MIATIIYALINLASLSLIIYTYVSSRKQRRATKETLRELEEAPLAPAAGCADPDMCFGSDWRRGFKLVSAEPCNQMGTYHLYQLVASWDDRRDRKVFLCDNCVMEADEHYPVITPEKLMAKLIKGEV